MAKIVISTQPSWLPLCKQLHAQGHELICLQQQMTKVLNDIDIPAKSLFDYLEAGDRGAALRTASDLHAQYYQLTDLPIFDHSPNLTTWLHEHGLATYFYPRLADIYLLLAAFARVAPNLLVVHNDVEPLHRLLALYARQHGIPTLHIPHAIYFETPDRGPIGSDVHDLVTADYLAAAGPFQAAWYHQRDPQQHIYITGLPQFDRLAQHERQRDRACKLLRLDPYRPVVTYMSSWAQSTNLLGCHTGVEESYLNFLAAARQLPDLQFIIKCHPRGNNAPWHAQMARDLGNKTVVTAEHLDVVLMASDAILSYGPSNVVLEAATVPGVRLLVTEGFADDPEIQVVGHETKTMLQGIARAFQRPAPDTTNLVYKYLGTVDGQATNRIAQLSEQLCRIVS